MSGGGRWDTCLVIVFRRQAVGLVVPGRLPWGPNRGPATKRHVLPIHGMTGIVE